MALSRSYQSVLDEIATLHAAKSRHKHPLWINLMSGGLTRNQVAEYIRQFSVVPLYNHFYHGELYMNCPNPEWRPRMAEIVYEEGTGRLFSDGVPHWKLYLNLGAAFGLTPSDLYNAKLCAGALGVRSYQADMCRSSFLQGISATSLGAESQVPGVFGKISETFIKHYGCTADEAMFFTVHEEADKDHSDAGLEFLQEFAKTDVDLQIVVTTVRNTLEVWGAMNDDIWRVLQDVK